jgi:homoserine dehydrogenase
MTGPIPLVLLGCGGVGRAVLAQLLADDGRFRLLGAADRTGLLLGADPAAILDHKAAGRPLSDLGAGAWRWPERGTVLVDVAVGATGARWREALDRGLGVVTANKAPLASPDAPWDVWEPAWRAGRLGIGGTVGAGVPTATYLRALRDGGDVIHRIDAVVSGTLHFVVARIGAGQPLSDAVAEAASRGYTEPDPAIDLSGADVGRKLTILGRAAGLWDGAPAIEVTGLVPDGWRGLAPADLAARLRSLNAPLAARVRAARDEGRRLRFVGTADRTGVRCGLRDEPADSPLGRLGDAENGAVLHSARFDGVPTTLTGPGFGPDVTAKTLLADACAVARALRT